MPKLVRYLLHHALLGFILAVVAVALMMSVDFAGLRTLIMASDVGGLALFMLTFFLGLTLASVQMGMAIAILNVDDPHSGRGRPRRGWINPLAMLAATVVQRPRPH